MKKILFLTPILPFPAVSGGTIKTLKLIEFISKKFEVHLCFMLKDQSEIDSLKEFELRNENIKCYYEIHNQKRNIKNLLLSYLNGKPLSIYRNYNSTFARRVKELEKEIDFIFVDHFLMFQYVKESSRKIIMHTHNAEFLMWERFSKENLGIKRFLIYFESLRIKKYEKEMLLKSNCTLAAPNDILEFKSILSSHVKFIPTLHLGDEELLHRPDLKFLEAKKSILYIGTLTWEANIKGLEWFLNNCWDKILEREPDTILEIIGKYDSSSDLIKFKDTKNVKFYGFVEDLNKFYESSRVFISPLFFGSGIKVKVVNSLYRGIPCVTTDVGVEGLEKLNDNFNIMIAKDSNSFIEKVLILLNDQVVWENISKKAREVALENYTWDLILKELDEVFVED